MLKVDVIDYKIEGLIIAFLFVLLISNKNTIIGNNIVFEDLNIYWFGLTKKDPPFNELFTI